MMKFAVGPETKIFGSSDQDIVAHLRGRLHPSTKPIMSAAGMQEVIAACEKGLKNNEPLPDDFEFVEV